ncbi:hypothetical protein GCM10009006_15950 [Haloarcula argentinensis]|uniref:Uncharacterized protein n=1 Tax=Haloarcula argentinensis TaxID=43776 RepID=A0A830FUK2_HALAR|nr:hypothetical protein GCM10009006_15950 [Haloarcula argentinensis]
MRGSRALSHPGGRTIGRSGGPAEPTATCVLKDINTTARVPTSGTTDRKHMCGHIHDSPVRPEFVYERLNTGPLVY